MEEKNNFKCVLCCSNLESVDTPPESFKSSVTNLWSLCNTAFSDSQKDLFEAGAFSQLKLCFDCRGMIEDAVSLQEKLKKLMGCIEENAKKEVEDEVEWPFKQFRAELKIVLGPENRRRHDQRVGSERLSIVQTGTDGGNKASNGDAAQGEPVELPTSVDDPPAFKKLKKGNKKPVYRPCTCQMSLAPKKNYGYVRKPSTNYPCDLCIVVCPTSAIAELHRKEVHQGTPPRNLSYHCENCDKMFNATEFCVNDDTLGSVFRLAEGQSHQNFKKFYMLCMGHFKDCKKRIVFASALATPLVVRQEGSASHSGTAGDPVDSTDLSIEFAPVITGLASNHSVSDANLSNTDSGDLPVILVDENDCQGQIVTTES